MARQPKVSCNRCDGRLGGGPYCPKCGYPTPWAAHEDRIEWELRQWSKREHVAPAPTAADPAVPPAETPALTAALEAAVASPATRRWFRSRKHVVGAPGVADGGEKVEPTEHAAEILESIEMLLDAAPEDHPAAEAAEVSPFAPAAEEAATRAPRKAMPAGPTVIHPKRPVRAKAGAASAEAITMKSPLAPKHRKDAAPAKKVSPRPRAAKPGPAVATPPAVAAASAPDVAPEPNVASMRAARRLPSLADIEQMAAEGPPITRIVRLLCAHIAVLEAQIPEDVAKTG